MDSTPPLKSSNRIGGLRSQQQDESQLNNGIIKQQIKVGAHSRGKPPLVLSITPDKIVKSVNPETQNDYNTIGQLKVNEQSSSETGQSPPGKSREQIEQEMMRELFQIQEKAVAEVDEQSSLDKRSQFSQNEESPSPTHSMKSISSPYNNLSVSNKKNAKQGPIIALHSLSPSGQKGPEEMMEVDSVKSIDNLTPKAKHVSDHNKPFSQISDTPDETSLRNVQQLTGFSHKRTRTLILLDEIIAQEGNTTNKKSSTGGDTEPTSSIRPSSQELDSAFIMPSEQSMMKQAARRPSGQPIKQNQYQIDVTQIPEMQIREDLAVTPKKERKQKAFFEKLNSQFVPNPQHHLRQDSISSQAATQNLENSKYWGDLVQKSQQEVHLQSTTGQLEKKELETALDKERNMFIRKQGAAQNHDIAQEKPNTMFVQSQAPDNKKNQVPNFIQQQKIQYAFLNQQDFDSNNLMNSLHQRKQSFMMQTKVQSIQLHNLLLFMISGTFRIHNLVISDYEICKQNATYVKILREKTSTSSISKHDAFFEMGKNLFYMVDYQASIENFNKALSLRPNDGNCTVWLGVANLYLANQISTKLQRMTNKHDQNYKTLQLSREKALIESVKLLTKCRKLQQQGLYANFALLILTFLQRELSLKAVPGQKEPEDYSNSIKQQDEYYGYIAWALRCIKGGGRSGDPNRMALGQNALQELIDGNNGRPEAYIALWGVEYAMNKNYSNALNIAEQLFICATDYQSYQEKLLLTVIYAKSLRRAQELLKAFTLLQLDYSRSPHYPSLLYLYGKYVVTSTLREFYGSGVGALDECMRQQCLGGRCERIRYYRGVAYQQEGRRIRAYMCFKQYLNLNVQLQEQSLSKLENIATFLSQFDSNQYLKVGEVYQELLTAKDLSIERVGQLKTGGNLHHLYHKVWDSDKFDADLYKALYLYKVYNEISNADKQFQVILKEYGQETHVVEAQIEYLKFLKVTGNLRGAQNLSRTLLERVDNEQITTTLWVQAHLEIAKVEHQLRNMDGAIQYLLKLRQVLPPIDTAQLSGFKLPVDFDEYRARPLYERGQGLFQEGLYQGGKKAEDDEGFDFDNEEEEVEGNFRDTLEMRNNGGVGKKQVYSSFITDEDFKEGEDASQRLVAAAATSYQKQQEQFPPQRAITEMPSSVRLNHHITQNLTSNNNNNTSTASHSAAAGTIQHLHKKSTSIMFFAQAPGTSSTDFQQHQQQVNTSRTQRGVSIRSSMPKIALMNMLQKQHSMEMASGLLLQMQDTSAGGERNLEIEAINEYMKDTNFSVYSDPKFLYLLGKLCARTGLLIYADLALQSFHDYFLIITYFKEYMRERDYALIKIKTYMWIARVLLNCEELGDCERMLNEVYLECLEIGDAVFVNFEYLWCQMHRAKGSLQSVRVDHFYAECHKPAHTRYLQ